MICLRPYIFQIWLKYMKSYLPLCRTSDASGLTNHKEVNGHCVNAESAYPVRT